MSSPSNIGVAELIHALEAACDKVTVLQEQQLLQEWQSQPGYHAALSVVALDQTVSTAVRLMACTQLKNGIEYRWRAGSVISLEEQSQIRSRLQAINLDEGERLITTFISDIFASVARRDFPRRWPDLFNDLIHLYQATNRTNAREFEFALKIIQKTITEFQTLRLATARSAYLEQAPRLFQTLANDRSLQAVLALNDPRHETLEQFAIFNAVLLFKCLRRLAIGAYQSPHYDEAVVAIWSASKHCLHVGMTIQNYENSWWMDLIGQIIKFHLKMAQNHPVSFAFMDPAELVHFYWHTATALRKRQRSDTEQDNDTLREGLVPYFILKALTLIRACFKAAHNSAHSMRLVKGQSLEERSQARMNLKSQVFREDFVMNLFEGLIAHYMLFDESDLDQWTDEAEEWEIKENDFEEAYEDSIRPCAERLFLDIITGYHDLVIQPLLDLVHDRAQSSDVFIKDAVYSALGLAASRLHGKFHFNHFFRTQIVQNMRSNAPKCAIIRRRIAILLSQWIPVESSSSLPNGDTAAPNSKSIMYSIYRDLLDPSDPRNDQVVRITAGRRLKEVGDEFGFQPEAFRPYAATVIRQIVNLILEVQIPETKLALLDTLRCLVERLEAAVLEFADDIIGLLQQLWQNLEKEQLMKKSIVNVLTKLAGSLKGASRPLQAFVVPLLQQVLDPRSPENLYLFEDSLDLLYELLQQSEPPVSGELIRVGIEYMSNLERPDAEYLEKLLKTLESLLLLAHTDVIKAPDIRRSLFSLLSPLVTIKNMQAVDLVTSCFELLVRATEPLDGTAVVTEIVSELAGFSQASTDCILGCWAAHQAHGPNRRDPPSSARSETYFFVVWARILLSMPAAFLAIVQTAASVRGAQFDSVMERILEEWFNHLDNVGDPAKTKMMILALTRLLETREPWILNKLQDFLTVWTSMILELRDGEDDKGGDTLVLPPYQPPSGPEATVMTPEDDRKLRLSHSDPVHTINLSHYVKGYVDALVEQHGGGQRFQDELLANVDKSVVSQFMELF